jgi:hypothetical protein
MMDNDDYKKHGMEARSQVGKKDREIIYSYRFIGVYEADIQCRLDITGLHDICSREGTQGSDY